MARKLNPRLAKINRSYTVEEVARRWGVHRNSVRQWVKKGLPTIDQKRPILIHGRDLAEFLQARRQQVKCKCQPGEIYCVRCRAARVPAGNLADYKPQTDVLGSLIGICPKCESLIYRRVNVTKLAEVRGELDVRVEKALSRIGESR
jgi:hypothetical protein